MDQYLMKAENILGDDHSFVRLVDTMPGIEFCDHMPDEPEGRDEVEPWEDIQHCRKAASFTYYAPGSAPGGLFCATHLPESAPPVGEKGSYLRGATERFYVPGDQRIVDAARVSIAGEGVDAQNPPEKLIRYLVKNRHTTPLEQVRFTFHVRLPIFCARQWIRHRTGSFNEESARYGKLKSDFYIPTMERMLEGGQAVKNKQGSGTPMPTLVAKHAISDIQKMSSVAYERYETLLRVGVARELARLVLPVNIYTQWFWTTDLHNLMHFLRLRLNPHAQWEMRQYGKAIVPMAEAIAPIAMAAWRETLGASEVA